MADIDLVELMKDSGLYPTQKEVFKNNINKYTLDMREEKWDWEHTKADLLEPMIKDTSGNIIAGHHRFIAAVQAGVDIPDDVVRIHSALTERIPRTWDRVAVREGERPRSRR